MIAMRHRWYRLLPLFVAALWLPFQAIAATAMPFCRHGEAHKMMAMVDDAAVEHCPMHEHQPAPVGHGMNCDDCGFCHLAAAGFMPTPERIAAVIPAARDFSADAPLAPASIIPEPPQQPPKRVA
jgi:hypothetical protein